MSNLSRRKLITTGIAATAGVSGLAAAAQMAQRNGLIPPNYKGIYGLGETLTYASQRLLTGNTLAREFPREKISKKPFANGKPFESEDFKRLEAGGFADWRLSVEGLVDRPTSLSLADIKAHPVKKQITSLACEEGWSYIAEWIGAPLASILETAGMQPQARFVVYYSMQPYWLHSIDMADALHPQTYLAYGMNGADLPVGHGGPLRMRLPRQLGYKSVKYITRLTVTDSLEKFARRSSYSWYAGI